MPRKAAAKSQQRPAERKLRPVPTHINMPKININFEPKTENQKLLIKAIEKTNIILAIGPAGVGKSYSAIAYALQMLCEKRIEKIILTRPYVTCDEDYGALPGTLQEKTQPLMQPMMSIIEDFIGKLLTANLIEEGKIEVAPLGFVRGSTYRDCVLIGDEFQNASKSQCYMLLSRIGENAKIILSGDIRQCDINPVNSGLVDLVKRCDKEPDFATVIFDSKDCLRSYMARRVIEIYEKK